MSGESNSTNSKSKKLVLITGSAKRLGAAIALKFAKSDYDVIIHYNISKNEAENIVKNNDIKLRYLEVAFGNYCNLACRTCNSELSTNWYEDDVHLYKSKGYTDRKPWQKITDVEYNWSGEELSELIQIKNFGKKSADEINGKLKAFGLSLKEEQ